MTGETTSILSEITIREILQKKDNYRKDIIICNTSTCNPIPKGNNYLSVIYKTNVEYKHSDSDVLLTASFILKSTITDEENDLTMFVKGMEKERRYYLQYLPKVNALIKTGDYLTPITYSTQHEDLLVLEDMTREGYRMADRIKGLDFQHCSVAISALAKFHALSVKVHEDEPQLVEILGNGGIFFNNEINPALPNFSTLCFKSHASELLSYPGMKKYAELVLQNAEVAADFVMELSKPNHNELNVLAHGDFWVTNMLFKYDDHGKPISMKIIDFTESIYTSPALDLWKFFNGSVEEDVRSTRLDELIDIYVTELNNNLKAAGSSKIVDKDEILQQLKDREFFGVYVTVWLLPFFKADPNNCPIVDINELLYSNDVNATPVRSYFQQKPNTDIIYNRISDYENSDWFKEFLVRVQQERSKSS